MKEPIFETSDGRDDMKSVSDVALIEGYLFIVEDSDPEVWSKCTSMLNLFAGNLLETQLFLDQMRAHGNTQVRVIAIDRTQPEHTDRKDALEASKNFRFLENDVFAILPTLPNDSFSIVTAFGAEYVFDVQGHSPTDFFMELERITQPGGMVIVPNVEKRYARGTRLQSIGDVGFYVKP